MKPIMLGTGIFLAFCSCSTHDIQWVSDEEVIREWIPWLQIGTTTSEEVLLNLGDPSGRFEKDTLFTYRFIIVDQGRGPRVMKVDVFYREDPPNFRAWRFARYNLVLAFDEQRKVRTYSVVQVR